MSYNTPTGFVQGGTFFTSLTAGSQTPARPWWGTASLSSGVSTVGVGFPVLVAFAGAYGANIGAGTISGAQVDPSLFSAGSVIVRGLLGTAAAGGGGTVAVLAFGG
jgi:hypothetical protein